MFYKYENQELIQGPFVTFPNGSFLSLDNKDLYNYPCNGYYYFETEVEAKTFFNIVDETV
ncbi:hypothetical protein UFOVP623_37 [uncultured Caudovirales phage]|uniref:Uncharacterized protein n=1 Tax=uncultured Caudovirales phage TaxID=2100421 RepID=A0A6J5N5U3_9CAUD|nr:hypothetical protein UFOVP623_37 [uncultured Caudovirales phage]